MDNPHGNAIGGAHIHGPVLQARDVAAVHLHPEAASRPAIPHQLAPAAAWFTDRRRALDWIEQAWQDAATRGAAPLLVITGAAGIGKSTAALHWLHTHRDRFPGGQLHLQLRADAARQCGPHGTGAALATALRALGVPPEHLPHHTEDAIALLRATATGHISILLDDPSDADQVRALRLAAPGCLTLVTSRRSLHALARDGARTHRLDPWPRDTGRAMLARALGPERVDGEPDAALRLSALCAGLPLALAVTAGRLIARPDLTLAHLVRHLTPEPSRLEHLTLETDTVNAIFDDAYAALPADQARLYRILGTLPAAWIDAPMAAAALHAPPEEAGHLLRELTDTALLTEPRPGRFTLPDLLRLHAAGIERTDSDEDRHAAAGLLDYLLHSATAAEEILTPSHRTLARDYTGDPLPPPFITADDALDWLEGQGENLLPALRYCAETHLHRTAWQLADAMWPLFLRLRVPDIRLQAQQIGLEAARHDGDQDAIGRFLTSLAGTLLSAADLEQAADYNRQAIAFYQRSGARRGQAQASNGLAKALLAAGDLDAAHGHFQQALDLRLAIGYRRGAHLSRHGLAQVAFVRGDLRRARELFDAAYQGLTEEGDFYDAAWSLALGAHARARLGQVERALDDLRRALAQMQDAGSAHGQVGVLEITAAVQQADGRHAAARASLQAAAALAEYDPAAQQRIGQALDASA